MSKQDSHFFNVFSAVLGLLVAIAIGLFIYSRMLGGSVTDARNAEDPLLAQEVSERIKPFGQVAVAGQDNAALAVAPAATATAVTGSFPAAAVDGASTYKSACSACHGLGIAGAPKLGDKAAWAARIAQGSTTLQRHAIEGYKGSAGFMPAKGGRMDLSDAAVTAAVDHMVAASR